ncbi:MAG: hypothetical protein IKC01_05745, partial [Clostridia bacterium]|nr:hypothetical protein [Clostridia bacterium]
MARDYNDYEDLLKNFDNYTMPANRKSGGTNANRESQRNAVNNTRVNNNPTVNSSSRNGQSAQVNSIKSEFHRDEIRPTPIRSDSNSNNVYFNRNNEPPTPRRQQNPNSPFY